MAEVAEPFLRTIWIGNDDMCDEFADELFYFDLLGKSNKGRTVQEIRTEWTWAQEKRKDEIDLLEEIVSQ